MKIKNLLISTAVVATCLTLTACDSGRNVIRIAVGNESADFYAEKAQDFLAANPDFKYKIEVVAADTGTAASTIITDPGAATDIFTVAHDNVGKLVEKGIPYEYDDAELFQQVEADNTESFVKVSKAKGKGMAQEGLFAVPYIAQALVLMYNKDKVTADEAKTFEGLQAAAARNNSRSVAITGSDGFNFSFTLLARNAETNQSSLVLYEGFDKTKAYCQGDDMVAIAKWGQDFFADDNLNGGLWPSDNGWTVDLQNNKCVAVIGGAWQFDAFTKAIGASKVGFTVLPTFTVDADDVEGTSIAAGTKYQAGTFYDAKVLMMNQYTLIDNEEKVAACQQLVKYFSSKEVQNESFKECNNLPAYEGAMDYIEQHKAEIDQLTYDGAKAQTGMQPYGIAQPFVKAILNNYYYQKKAPELYVEILSNAGKSYEATAKVREGLYKMEHIWQKGQLPGDADLPTSYPQDI